MRDKEKREGTADPLGAAQPQSKLCRVLHYDPRTTASKAHRKPSLVFFVLQIPVRFLGSHGRLATQCIRQQYMILKRGRE